MNGRCDYEPLDVAEDICDLCGGEYCQTCLLWPRGHKRPPVCKPCAIKNSGVRGSAKTERKSTRREAKKRREELLETKDERSQGGFVFFDESEDFDLPTDEFTGSGPDAEPTRRRLSLGRKKGGEEEDGATTADRGMNSDSQLNDVATGHDSGDADPSEAERVEDDPTTPTDPHSATALLERIRATGHHPGTQIAGPSVESLELPDILRPSEPVDSAPPVGFPQAFHDADPFSSPEPHQSEAAAGEPVFAAERPSFDPQFDPFSLQVDPFVPTMEDPFGPAPAQTVHVAPSQPPPSPPLPPEPLPPEPPETRTMPGAGATSADIDAKGNWVPPVLRGMAPKEERVKETLPRRRQELDEVSASSEVPAALRGPTF